jgi:hemerythrin-like domain-containing protein
MKTKEELAREARNEYHRQWRRNNPDKVKKNIENYWLRKAEKLLRDQKTGKDQKTD